MNRRVGYEVWDQWIFDNIAASEQQHMDAVKKLLYQYGINDPVGDDVEGEFHNSVLQELYYDLISTGSSVKIDALWVGATIEDMDIYDIQQMLKNTGNSDLVNVYENLMRGSRNHLRSFCGLMETLEETYDAQYLSQEEVDSITSSPKETGPK